MPRSRYAVLLPAAGALIFFLAVAASAQEAPPPPDQPAAPVGSSSSKQQNKKPSHANDFLIIGTVFSEKGYAFPGVELRIRRASEKKFRWDVYTNSRGEFAVRVPQGADYEMLIRAKGFSEQTKAIDAKSGVAEARMVFRMEPGKDDKK